jgi:hypothetical protein
MQCIDSSTVQFVCDTIRLNSCRTGANRITPNRQFMLVNTNGQLNDQKLRWAHEDHTEQR